MGAAPAPIDSGYLDELEARLRDAREIHVAVDVEGNMEMVPATLSLDVRGTDTSWRWSGVRGGRPFVLHMEGDAQRTRIRFEQPEPRESEMPTATDLRDFLARGLSALGLQYTAGNNMVGEDLRNFSDGRPCCWAEHGDVRVEGTTELDGRPIVILHAQTLAFGQPRGETRVWVDPERRLPVRREVMERRTAEEPVRIVERYTRFDVVR